MSSVRAVSGRQRAMEVGVAAAGRARTSIAQPRTAAVVAIVTVASGALTSLAIAQGAVVVTPVLLLLPALVLAPTKALVGGLFVLLSTASWLDYRILEGRFENVLTVPLLLAGGLLFIWLLSLMLGRVRVVRSTVALALLVFIGANLASTLWNYPGLFTRHMMLGNLLHGLNAGVFMMTASVVAASGGNRRQTTVLLLVGIGVAALGAGASQISTFLESSRVLWKTNPVYTASLQTGGVGRFGATVSLVSLSMLLEARRNHVRAVFLPLVLLGALIDLLAWQRTQFVALVAGIATVSVVKGLTYGATLAALIAVLILLFPSLTGTVWDIFTFQPMSFETRTLLWQEALHVWMANPVFGVGPSQYRQGVSWTHPHNQYLTVAAETGVVGLGCFLALVGILAWTAVTTYRRTGQPLLRALSLAGAGLVAAEAVGGLASGGFLQSYARSQFGSFSVSVYFWAMMGLMVGIAGESTD